MSRKENHSGIIAFELVVIICFTFDPDYYYVLRDFNTKPFFNFDSNKYFLFFTQF